MVLYKNWPEICKIGRLDKLLMLVLAATSENENDEIAMRLYVAFPECFSSEQVSGPFPLSAIRHLADANARFDANLLDGGDYPFTYDALSAIPLIFLEVLGEDGMPETDNPTIQKSQAQCLKQGDIYEWEGRSLVVLEVSRQCQGVTLAPAECIILDL